MKNQHRHRQQTTNERERREQAQQATVIEGTHRVIQPEGCTRQDIAHGHTEHQCRYKTADEQAPVPERAPFGFWTLGAVLEADRTQDQRRQHQEHGQIKAREADRIDKRPCSKDRTTAENEPDLVPFPCGTDRIDDHAAFRVGLGDEGQQGTDTEVKTVGQGKSNQQNADQCPPDHAKRGKIEKQFHLRLSFSARHGGIFAREQCLLFLFVERALFDGTDNQPNLDHGQSTVEQRKADNRGPQLRNRQA